MLQFARSTYYATKTRPPSARSVEDERLKPEIARVHRSAYHGVYGAEKVWWQLEREGFCVGRDKVARLMREMGLSGVVRGQKKTSTTTPDGAPTRPGNLVKRNFTADAPNRLGVADFQCRRRHCTSHPQMRLGAHTSQSGQGRRPTGSLDPTSGRTSP